MTAIISVLTVIYALIGYFNKTHVKIVIPPVFYYLFDCFSAFFLPIVFFPLVIVNIHFLDYPYCLCIILYCGSLNHGVSSFCLLFGCRKDTPCFLLTQSMIH